MRYFIFAMFGLFLYVTFMISKFLLRVRVTKFVVFLHVLTAFAAVSSFLLLLLKEFTFKPLSFLGFIFIIPGFVLVFLAALKLRGQTFVPKHVLVKSDIYAYVRNPMYLGLILLSYAAIFFSFSVYVAFYAAMLTVLYQIVIKVEERELSKRLGGEYDKYRRGVPSLIPRFLKVKYKQS